MNIKLASFMFFQLLFSTWAFKNHSKFTIDQKILNENNALELKDYSTPDNVDNLFYFYDIKIAYNRLKGLRNTFLERLNKCDLRLVRNLSELDIFKNFEDLTTVYKYQVTCQICKKNFKTSQYLWIHTTRSHLFEKYNENDPQANIFWLSTLSEFLDWDLKNHIRIQDFDLNSEVYYKFKKCLLFAKKYIESQNFEKLYDFCLGFYFEKDSKGKIQDFMSQAYNLLFKALLVVFVIACLIYYSFAYYIYVDYSEYQSADKRKKKAIEYDDNDDDGDE